MLSSRFQTSILFLHPVHVNSLKCEQMVSVLQILHAQGISYEAITGITKVFENIHLG